MHADASQINTVFKGLLATIPILNTVDHSVSNKNEVVTRQLVLHTPGPVNNRLTINVSS